MRRRHGQKKIETWSFRVDGQNFPVDVYLVRSEYGRGDGNYPSPGGGRQKISIGGRDYRIMGWGTGFADAVRLGIAAKVRGYDVEVAE